MIHEFSRMELLLGAEGIEKLKKARVAVFGVGGVGGYAVEALARSGIGALDLVDDDTVSLTNLNRQIIALHSTVGRPKVEVAAERRCKKVKSFSIVSNHKNAIWSLRKANSGSTSCGRCASGAMAWKGSVRGEFKKAARSACANQAIFEVVAAFKAARSICNEMSRRRRASCGAAARATCRNHVMPPPAQPGTVIISKKMQISTRARSIIYCNKNVHKRQTLPKCVDT